LADRNFNEMKITAKANSNIALIKYWGKRDVALNLPAVGSVSMTLDGLETTTSVEFSSQLSGDTFYLNNRPAQKDETVRLSRFLDLVREKAGSELKAEVHSANNFPTAAGLASSASGFAALALAATRALGVELTSGQLSELARQGSGSAARSVFGGFVQMHHGRNPDGSDAVAEQIADESFWDVRLLIAITTTERKKTGSTDGMELSRRTSPYYQAWMDHQQEDLLEMRRAILARDFHKVGELSEFSCLKMHALALSSNPGLIYWNGTTVKAMHLIRELRHSGLPVYFTIDAGPQLKALCLPEAAQQVQGALSDLNGVQTCLVSRPGQGVKIIREE